MQYFTIIFSLMMIVLGGIGAADDFPRLGMTVLIGGLALGVHSISKIKSQKKTPKLSLKDIDEEKAQLLSENFDKAITDYRYLQSRQDKLGDKEMNNHLKRMQRTAKNLILHLEKHPERIPTAFKFIDYYQDRAVKIVQQYEDLEETELSTDKVRALKERMKGTLASLDEAYTEQFEHVLNDQMLSVDAELKVMEQQLDAEGIKRQPIALDLDTVDEDGNPIYNPYSKQLGRKRKPPKIGRPVADINNLTIIPEGKRAMVIHRKLVQSALAIFFGALGAHLFYRGKTFSGFLRLFLSLTFVMIPLMSFIGFCEGIRYLFMSLDDFYLQYVEDDDN
ncbi:MAG: 5-bromo-4-chloroindolyl phosphate hydrolysis family protein [Selenomonadaceae bacterium]|nr:5-bromo-4-chloroindolyl phosphate hydrolysis family protein [Selenomonadaceae bacterium]